VGRIMMKCLLSDMPELRLGLNEKIEDITFHQVGRRQQCRDACSSLGCFTACLPSGTHLIVRCVVSVTKLMAQTQCD
jgi:hypothetical protein